MMTITTFLALLLAIAVPTFQQQKESAVGANVRANVKQVVNAIEACAAGNASGAYVETGAGQNCLDRDTILEQEPALAQVGDFEVEPADDPTMSYTVTVTARGASFTETHNATGQIERTCTPEEGGGCHDGTW